MASITKLTELRANLTTPSALPVQPRLERRETDPHDNMLNFKLSRDVALWLIEKLMKEYGSLKESYEAMQKTNRKRPKVYRDFKFTSRTLNELNQCAQELL